MTIRSVALPVLCALAVSAGGQAAASWCAPVGPDLVALGWRPLTFDGKSPNRFAGSPDGTLEVAGDGSVSFLFVPVPAAVGAQAETLRWSWKADASVPPTDLAVRGGDDRTIALYVAFAWDPGQASLSETLRRPFVEMMQGADAPGRILAYTWGGGHPPGARFASPYAAPGSEVIIARGADAATGTWFEEMARVREDYARAFGADAPPVTQVAVVSDSDDTGTAVRAAVRGLCLDIR